MSVTIAVDAQLWATRRTAVAAERIPSPRPPTSGELIRPSSPASRSAPIERAGNAPSPSTSAASASTVGTASSRARVRFQSVIMSPPPPPLHEVGCVQVRDVPRRWLVEPRLQQPGHAVLGRAREQAPYVGRRLGQLGRL